MCQLSRGNEPGDDSNSSIGLCGTKSAEVKLKSNSHGSPPQARRRRLEVTRKLLARVKMFKSANGGQLIRCLLLSCVVLLLSCAWPSWLLSQLGVLVEPGAFVIVVVEAQQNPSIVQITPGQTVDLGDTIDLSCSVQYGSNYPIIWTKLSDNPSSPPLFISKDAALTVYDNRYSIRHDDSSSTYTLQVSKIQETDTGAYQCQVVTSATSRVTADTFISVRIPPLILDSSSRGLTVGAGETFTLSCNATGVPTPRVSWRRENNGLLPTGGVVAKGNSITIYNATKDDRGIYYCIADNSVGKAAKRSVGVEIEFAPQVSLIRARYRQALGYPAELHCSVEASPAADISWLKDGYQINSDNNFYHISSSSNSHDFIQSTLRLRRVEQRDFGSYRCRAINKLGDRQNAMVLEQAYEPICPPACTAGEFVSITTSAGASLKPAAAIIATALFLMTAIVCCSLPLSRVGRNSR